MPHDWDVGASQLRFEALVKTPFLPGGGDEYAGESDVVHLNSLQWNILQIYNFISQISCDIVHKSVGDLSA